MGAVPWGNIAASGSSMSWPQFCHDFRISWPRFSPGATTIDHDRGLIVRRLGVDLVVDLHENISDDRGVDSASNAPRSRLDRAAIAVRSDRNRGVLLRGLWIVR